MSRRLTIRLTPAEAQALLEIANEGRADLDAREDYDPKDTDRAAADRAIARLIDAIRLAPLPPERQRLLGLLAEVQAAIKNDTAICVATGGTEDPFSRATAELIARFAKAVEYDT